MHTVLTFGCWILLGLIILSALTAVFCIANHNVSMKKEADKYTRKEIEDIIDTYYGKLDNAENRGDVEEVEYILDCIDYYKGVLDILKKREVNADSIS